MHLTRCRFEIFLDILTNFRREKLILIWLIIYFIMKIYNNIKGFKWYYWIIQFHWSFLWNNNETNSSLIKEFLLFFILSSLENIINLSLFSIIYILRIMEYDIMSYFSNIWVVRMINENIIEYIINNSI